MPNENDALKSFTQSIEAALKALYGREVVVSIQFKEPEYEYVTTGEVRAIESGEWFYGDKHKTFLLWDHPYPSGDEVMIFRRVEKKGNNA